MKPKPNSQPSSRAEALRTGRLLDITATAQEAGIMMPAAMSAALWQAVSGGDRFRPKHPRVLQLCWSANTAVRTGNALCEENTPESWTLWVETVIGERTLLLRVQSHRGDQGELVLTLGLEAQAPPASREGWPYGMSRSEALRTGRLLDISDPARQALIQFPVAMSPALWRAVAGQAPFDPQDPRLLDLCWSLVLTRLMNGECAEQSHPHRHTVWFETRTEGRVIRIRSVLHAGEESAVAVSLFSAEEPDAFNPSSQS